jgi:hypothetical protein
MSEGLCPICSYRRCSTVRAFKKWCGMEMWPQEKKGAFHQLKKLLIQHTQLDHPLDDKELIVHADR